MTKPEPRQIDIEEVAGPAIITPLHVKDRPVGKGAGAKLGWRKWTPLEAAFEQGKLSGGAVKYDARARLAAGLRFADIWDRSEPGGRDSTQAMNGSRGTGGGLPLSHRQLEAKSELARIRDKMGKRDFIIIRMVCGEGYFPSEAVKLVSEEYKFSVWARFREAMDALVEVYGA